MFDDLSGEIAALCSVKPSAGTDIDTQCLALAGYLLQGHVVDVPLGVSPALVFDRLQHLAAGTSPDCVLAPTLAEAAEGATTWRYRCLIQPGDNDSDPTTPRIWAGRVRLAGVPSGLIACRMSASPGDAANWIAGT